MRTPYALWVVATASILMSVRSHASAESLMDAATLEKKIAQFAVVDLDPDLSALPAAEKAALGKLIEASKVMDALFLRQVWSGNEPLLLDLIADPSREG